MKPEDCKYYCYVLYKLEVCSNPNQGFESSLQSMVD
jgi:hypothetical protein